MTHYEAGKIYLKIKNGGASIAICKNAFIIGIYNDNKYFKYDDETFPQSPSICNTIIEDAAETLIDNGY